MKKEYQYHYLYKITNNINGKIYIGLHSTNDLEDNYMGSGVVLIKAYKKYGKDNFTKEIIRFVPTLEDLNDLERWVVDQNFVDRKDTYNRALGGCGGTKGIPSYWKGKHLPDEVKAKISEATKEGMHKEENWNRFLEGIRNRNISGENNHMYGKHLSEETKKKISENKERSKKISESLQGHIISEETRQKISESNKGKKSWNKGIKMSKEFGEKISNNKERSKKISESSKKPKRKFLWKTPDGQELIMTINAARRYHKDWIMIKEIE